MKVIRDKVSNSYYNIYLILTRNEKNKYIDIVKRELEEMTVKSLSDKITEEWINFRREKDPITKNHILETIKTLKSIEPIGNEITDELIRTYLPSALMDFFIEDTINGDYAPCLNIEGNVIGDLSEDKTISIKYSFCYVPSNYELVNPSTKGNPYFYSYKDTEMLINEILIGTGNYSKRESLLTTEFSDILFTYIKDDKIEKDIYKDITKVINDYNINKKDILGIARGTYNLINENQESFTIIIKDIYNKEVYELNDEIVQKLNMFQTTSVKKFREKIEEVYSRYLNINSNINSLTKRFLELNKFDIDEFVVKHYYRFKDIEDTIENSYKYLDDIKRSFLYGLLIDRCVDLDDLGRSIAIDEYELFKNINREESESTLMEYIFSRGPIVEIYYYLKKERLITERR